MENLDPFPDGHTIEKGSVRLGSETYMQRMHDYGFVWTELSCLSPVTVKLAIEEHESIEGIPGFDELSLDQQLQVREQLAALAGLETVDKVVKKEET